MKLLFPALFILLQGCNPGPQQKGLSALDSVQIELSVHKHFEKKILRRLDSLEMRYNMDYAYNQVIQDTLYILATKREANLSGWRKAGRKIRELVEGYKEAKAVVPFL